MRCRFAPGQTENCSNLDSVQRTTAAIGVVIIICQLFTSVVPSKKLHLRPLNRDPEQVPLNRLQKACSSIRRPPANSNSTPIRKFLLRRRAVNPTYKLQSPKVRTRNPRPCILRNVLFRRYPPKKMGIVPCGALRCLLGECLRDACFP